MPGQADRVKISQGYDRLTIKIRVHLDWIHLGATIGVLQ